MNIKKKLDQLKKILLSLRVPLKNQNLEYLPSKY
jgi:ribosomal protein L29